MCKVTKYLGPAGSGKTTRLLNDIDSLIKKGYRKDDFIITTFRRSLADVIRERLGWMGEETSWVNTIHGICLKLSSQEDEIKGLVLDQEQEEFCKEVGMEYHKSSKNRHYDNEPRVFGNDTKIGNIFFDAHNFLVCNLLECNQIHRYPEVGKLKIYDPEYFMNHMTELYTAWKKERGLYDFPDMLKKVHDDRIVPDAKILVVDEAQDLTPIQYEIIRIWKDSMDIMILAGDPRQCVYGFWGARARFFELFEGEEITLGVTYRYNEVILKYANRILDRAGLKHPDMKAAGSDGEVKIISEGNYQEQLPLFKEKTFHLFRTNRQGEKTALNLAMAGIPFDGIWGWTTRQINLYNAIWKIQNKPKIVEIYNDVWNKKDKKDSKEGVELRHLLGAFPKGFFERTRSTPTQQTFDTLERGERAVHTTEYLCFDELLSENPLNNSQGGLKEPDNLGRIKILAALKYYNKELIEPINVVVSTIHKAKGDEADTVFLHNGIIKKIHRKLYSNISSVECTIATEEEAQIFHVGASRSKRTLFIVMDDSKYTYSLPDVRAS